MPFSTPLSTALRPCPIGRRGDHRPARGQLASAAGVNPQTLRYYERRGLLERPDLTNGGHRLYPAEAITLLRVIKTAQRLGFTLAEVADLLAAGTHHHGRTDDGLRLRAEAKLSEIEQKITDLTIIRESLRQAIDAGCDDLMECAGSPQCPLPFTALVPLPEPGTPTTRRRRG